MKIKKSSIILSSIMTATLLLSIITMTISVNIGSKDGKKYLSNLPDYDWSTADYGDKYDFQYQDVTTNANNIAKLSQSKSKADKWGKYIDYPNFNTGYQWTDSIKKQAVTGSPTSKIFMPNGNKASDFGVTSKAEINVNLNSYLSWNPNEDYDAKYNASSIPYREQTKTLLKWNKTQNEKVNSLYMGFTSLDHRAAVSTMVGVKNPFNNTFTSYQYANTFDDWGGSFFEGIIKIPAADAIDSAHKNGGKIYANIFLDGYHGLTRRMLTDFLKKDNSGHYLIVDKLIQMAKYFGFDGFFWNNESNGGLPNGTVLDYNNLYEIFKQLKAIISNSDDENISRLKNIFYSSYSNLDLNEEGKPVNVESNKMSEVADAVTLDFGQIPRKMSSFLASNEKWGNNANQYKIYNIIEGASTSVQGMYDTRMLTNYYYNSDHSEITDFDADQYYFDKNKNNTFSFENNEGTNSPVESYAFYEDGGASSYGSTIPGLLDVEKNPAYKAWLDEGDHKQTQTLDQLLLEQQTSHIADEMLYSGRNRFTRGAAHEADPTLDESYKGKIGWTDGLDKNKTSAEKISDLKIDAHQTEDYGVTNNGWNGEWSGMSRDKVIAAFSYDDGILPSLIDDDGINEWNLTDDQLRWLFAKDSDGNFVYSFGGGDIQQESTIINDLNPEFDTNFSTGSGVMFSDADGSTYSNYPWTNKRLQDLTPTYNWDVIDLKDDAANINLDELQNVPQNKITGFYDYYNPYVKGNSVALAKKLNYDGSIKGFDLQNKNILWNIFGTNVKGSNLKNKSVKMKFKLSTNVGDDKNSNAILDALSDLKINLALTDQDKKVTQLELSPKKIDGRDGWYEATVDLSTYAQNVAALGKIGLVLSGNESDKLKNIIFNLGQMSLTDNDKIPDEETYSVDPETITSEYVIQRDLTLNARIAWKNVSDNISYYEVYIYDPESKNIYRVGETTQNIYYIHDILSKRLMVGIKPVTKNGALNNEIKFQEITK